MSQAEILGVRTHHSLCNMQIISGWILRTSLSGAHPPVLLNVGA